MSHVFWLCSKRNTVYSWFLAKNLAYAECWIMKFHYRNSSNLGACFIYTRIYGHLRWPFFSPFGYRRVPKLFRVTNIWNSNDSEGMTIFGRNDTNLEGITQIWKEWQKSGRNDSNMEGMAIMRKEWQKVLFKKKIFLGQIFLQLALLPPLCHK